MRKAGKRFISMLLAVIMVMGVLMAGFTNVSAATFTPRTSLPSNARSTITQYITGSGSSKNPYTAFNVGNCTWYAFGRAWEMLGYRPSNLIFQGDAVVWFSKNKSNYDNGNGGFPYSTNPSAPKLGAIACFSDDRKTDGTGGHVAVVEEIMNDGTIKTSESGYNSFYFQYNTRNTSVKGFGWSNYTFLGYIYLGDYTTTPVGNNPQGVLDIVEGKTGQIFVRGWAFDADSPSSSILVHVYIGGPAGTGEGHEITANISRPDVNSAYNITGNHGYSQYITTSMSGNQTVYVYAINQYGGGENVLIGSKTVTIIADTENPAFSDTKIIDRSKTGYTISLKMTDNVAISHVNCYTWTDANGRDDEKCTQGIFSDSTILIPILFSDHNNEKGNYTSHIYGYDLAGNYCFTVVSVGVESNVPTISNWTVTNITPSGYVVSCEVTDDTEIDYVQFPTWSAQTGLNNTDQDDIIWGTGTKSGNTYSYNVKISEHNNERGRYKTHIYVYDVWGNVRAQPIENIYVPSPSELYTITYNANGGTGAPASHSDYVNVKLSSTKPTRSGYTFLGWATSSSAMTAQYQPGETISPGKSITLYAVWKQNTFTLTYNPNGGTNPPANQTGNGNITLSDTKPTKSGYTFLGWATSSSATTAQYQPGASFSLTNDTTFYAVWTPVTLSSISIKTMPTKTTYTVGESFNLSGLTLTAKYSDNSTQTISSGFTCSGFSSTTAGTKTITVTYEGKTTTFTVTVNPAPVTLTSISVKTMPTKTTYTVGESFNQSGLTLTAKYSDNSTQTVTSGFTCSGFSSTTAGTKTITVTYEGKTTTFNVTVINKDEPQTKIVIHNYVANRIVDYKTTITFSADVTNPVSGATVHWFIDGKDAGTGDKYTVTKAKKSYTVQVKYIKDGKVLAESGVETVNVKTGFFAKLAAFFKSIFGALPKVVQGYLGVEIIEKFIP